MKAISMYSGGCDGMGVAFEKAGFDTVAKCDSDEACRLLLRKRNPEVLIFEDDTEVTRNGLRKNGIDPTTINIIYGSPPCQCASVAGKRLGDVDERNRWPQFLRSVCSIRPKWIVAENVPGLLSVNAGRLFGDILGTLAKAGYDVTWKCWPASAIGAPHERNRLFIIAKLGNTEQVGRSGKPWRRTEPESTNGYLETKELGNTKSTKQSRPIEYENQKRQQGLANTSNVAHTNHRCGNADKEIRTGWFASINGSNKLAHTNNPKATRYREHGGQVYADTEPKRLDDSSQEGRTAQPGLGRNINGVSPGMDRIARELQVQRWPAYPEQEQYSWEPPRVATGIKNRTKRLEIIGNSCPWQQYYPIAALIKLYEVTENETI